MTRFFALRSQKWSVGLDIGTEQVKLVCLGNGPRGPQLMAHAIFMRNDHKGIEKALQHPSIKSGSIRVSIEDPTLRVRKIELPPVPKQEIDEIAKWAIRDSLKSPLENFVYRYYPIESATQENGSVRQYFIFLALEKEKFILWQNQLKKLGIVKPNIIEPHVSALANTISYSYEPKDGDIYALIDFGKSVEVFSIVSSKGLIFSRTIFGAPGLLLEQQVSSPDKLRHTLTKLCMKLQHFIDGFQLHHPIGPPTQILITGGGANISVLDEHIESTLQISTSRLEPFKKIDISRFDSRDLELKMESFGVALGLAL